MRTQCYYIHALTGLHMGTGQGTGIIDLPIAREKSTGLPIVPGSGIKGVLREECRPEGDTNGARKLWCTLFGPEATDLKDTNGFAGALNFQDAQLLCLPVRSVKGVFAWVSCPFILERYRRDLALVSGTTDLPTPPQPSASGKAAGSSGECILGHSLGKTDQIFLEDISLEQEDHDDVAQYATRIANQVFPGEGNADWQEEFSKRFLVVSDDVFSFLAETGTEIRARIRIKENTRTVAKGALWYEENLPAETILWGITGCDRSRNTAFSKQSLELLEMFAKEMLGDSEVNLQVGGNATVGRGNIRLIFSFINQGG